MNGSILVNCGNGFTYTDVDMFGYTEGEDIKLYVGEQGADLVKVWERQNPQVDKVQSGIIADYLEGEVEQSELRDIAIKFFRDHFNS